MLIARCACSRSRWHVDYICVGTQNYDSGPSVYNALVQDHASAHSVNIDDIDPHKAINSINE